MDEAIEPHRLAQIRTRWSLIWAARASDTSVRQAALAELFERYAEPVYRYLLALTRDADVADEVFQQFATKLLTGGLNAADPARGRFRSYVSVTLANMVRDDRRAAKRRGELEARAAEAAPAPTVAPSLLDRLWREELLEHAWRRLGELETDGQPCYHAVLALRVAYPDASSEALASLLTERVQPAVPYTATNVRKLLQRARAAFADGLIDELSLSLEGAPLDEVEEELAALDLLRYCKQALARRRAATHV